MLHGVSSVRWAFPHNVPVSRGGQVGCAWTGRSGLKACTYTCAQRFASVCVCVSVLFCTLQKLPEWMVWHTLGLLVMPKDLICLAVGQGWLAQDANQKLPSTKGSCLTCFCSYGWTYYILSWFLMGVCLQTTAWT